MTPGTLSAVLPTMKPALLVTLLAVTLAFCAWLFRFTICTSSSNTLPGAYRLDRWTGAVEPHH